MSGLLDIPFNAIVKQLFNFFWSEALFCEDEVVDGMHTFMRIVGFEDLKFEESDDPLRKWVDGGDVKPSWVVIAT